MTLDILLFGITTDLLGTSSVQLTLAENNTVADLKSVLKTNYPSLQKLKSYAVAINETYATDDAVLKPNDVVAIIPPVSGG